MTISRSLDEKFIERLREIIDEQQRHLDSLNYDMLEKSKRISALACEINDLSEENEFLSQKLNQESYFLEKLNLHLELELTGQVPRFEVCHDKKK